MPVVSALACALIEAQDPVLVEPGSGLAALIGAVPLVETYRCSFGINPAVQHIFDGVGLQVAARDQDGAVRAMMLAGHRFFLGTAFLPERAALAGRRHPIISAFVDAILG
jgi:CTP synthase (UTP-ammonia lyase)